MMLAFLFAATVYLTAQDAYFSWLFIILRCQV